MRTVAEQRRWGTTEGTEHTEVAGLKGLPRMVTVLKRVFVDEWIGAPPKERKDPELGIRVENHE